MVWFLCWCGQPPFRCGLKPLAMFDDTGFFFWIVIHRFGACCFGDSYSGHKLESGLSWLVGGLEHVFPYIGNFIIPTDKLIFFRGVGQPPTRWCSRFAFFFFLLLLLLVGGGGGCIAPISQFSRTCRYTRYAYHWSIFGRFSPQSQRGCITANEGV